MRRVLDMLESKAKSYQNEAQQFVDGDIDAKFWNVLKLVWAR